MSLGLVGAATAAAPLDTLEELLATQAAKKEAAFKRQQELAKTALETRRVGVEEGGLGLQRSEFGAKQDKEKADDAEFQQTLALAPEWLKPALRLRRQGLTTSLQPEDMTMSPEQQHTQKVGDAATVAAAASAAKEKEAQEAFQRQLQLRREPTFKDLHPKVESSPFLSVLSGTTPAANQSGDGETDEKFLATLNPQTASIVKMLAEGTFPTPSGTALKDPKLQQAMALAKRYDPSFDAVNYATRAATRKAFTSGTQSDQVNNLNAALGHLAELQTASDKLGNYGFTPANWAKNATKSVFGSSDMTDFNVAKNRVAPEVAGLYNKGGGTVSEIDRTLQDFGRDAAPNQNASAITETAKLIQSKLDALEHQYQQGMGTKRVSILSPSSKQLLSKLLHEDTSTSSTSSSTPSASSSPTSGALQRVVNPDGSITYKRGG